MLFATNISLIRLSQLHRLNHLNYIYYLNDYNKPIIIIHYLIHLHYRVTVPLNWDDWAMTGWGLLWSDQNTEDRNGALHRHYRQGSSGLRDIPTRFFRNLPGVLYLGESISPGNQTPGSQSLRGVSDWPRESVSQLADFCKLLFPQTDNIFVNLGISVCAENMMFN